MNLKEYVRDKNGNKCGILSAYKIELSNRLIIMTSFCDIRYDKFIDNIANLKSFNGDFNKIPFGHKDQFNKFLLRCKRYYKNDVIYPKWFVSKSYINFELSQLHFINGLLEVLPLSQDKVKGNPESEDIVKFKLSLTHEGPKENKRRLVTVILKSYDATYSNSQETILIELDSVPFGNVLIIKNKEYLPIETVTYQDLDNNKIYHKMYVRLNDK